MPEGFAIGPLYVHFYGILIMLGALAAAWVADREAKRRGLNTDHIWDMLPWILIGGVIGARLWHVLTPTASLQSLLRRYNSPIRYAAWTSLMLPIDLKSLLYASR